MSKRWLLKSEPQEKIVSELTESLGIQSTLAKLLAQRGVANFDQAKDFFRPQLEHLHDPFLMKDMDKAVNRILKAIEAEENILVYGDYDVDGATSVALMYSFLSEKHSNVSHYIPDRYAEGYGVSEQGIEYAADNNIGLIIALDCGIKAIEKVDLAKQKGIDFIICDHHLPGKKIPDAIAVLDPKRSDCDYPFKELSGCGVGFKLIHALSIKMNIPLPELYSYLDLVVVSIAADIVPITGENRTLAYYGLKILNKNPRTGLKMLIPSESKGKINISKIVFSIAPKINAAGRIKHAVDAVKLLVSENKLSARRYVSDINELNTQRKNLDANITESALAKIKDQDEEENYTTVLLNEKWHKGVIGIVASRLTDVYYRPTVIFTKGEDGSLVASARSVKGFDVYEAISQCSDLLDRYGGHMYAAGLTMQEINFPNFKRRFEEVVKNSITKSQRIPVIDIDSELNFSEITSKFIRILKQFEPFGPGQMTPLFLTKGVRSAGNETLMGKDKEHLKLNVFTPNARAVFTTVGFGMGHLYKRFKTEPFDLVYSIEENVWQGKSHLQLQIRDVRFL